MNPRNLQAARGPGRECPAAIGVLRARCAGLGMPTWWFDPAGQLLGEPTEEGPAGQWLRAPMVRETVTERVLSWAQRQRPEDVECFVGCRLLGFEERQGRRTQGFLVAMALGPAVFDAPEFSRTCQTASIDVDRARRALAPLACFGPQGLDRVATLLGWMKTDLAQAARDRGAVDEYSFQLTEMYEEIGLLYRLAGP